MCKDTSGMGVVQEKNHASDAWFRKLSLKFELIHLALDSMMDDEILWLVAQYCAYVYGQKKQKAHNYIINVDKLRSHLMGLYAINQKSQNVLAHIPF